MSNINELILKLLDLIYQKELNSSSGDASASNQTAQIALETAISTYLATIAPNSTTNLSLLTTLNSIVATAAKQDSQIALANPTTKYKIAETDTIATPYYFGFVDKDGNWYIMKQVVNSATSNTFTFVVGSGNFSTPSTGAWATRASQTYVTFDTAF